MFYKASLQGHRDSNEDAEICFYNFAGNDKRFPPIDLNIICDGHGGSKVSNFVAKRLKEIFLRPQRYPMTPAAIIKIFDDVQREIEYHPDKIGADCGSTALVIIKYRDTTYDCLQVINLGDCRALIGRNGYTLELTKDHKPELCEEHLRIKKLSQERDEDVKVHYEQGAHRVFDLSVSRAFGDNYAKPYVSHEPDVIIYPIEHRDDFLIMACDGLYESLKSNEAVNFVKKCFADNDLTIFSIPQLFSGVQQMSNKNIAERLALYAIARGSMDNVSIIITKLK